jgi:hypothetical protein
MNGKTAWENMKDLKEEASSESTRLTIFTVRRVNLDEVMSGALPKGCLIMVRWLDASDVRASLREHKSEPEDRCKDWGLYLGVSGRARKLLLKTVLGRFEEQLRHKDELRRWTDTVLLQARNVAAYLRGDKPSYEGFSLRW